MYSAPHAGDGVSEGQFKEVKRVEVAAILGACSQLQGPGGTAYQPTLTFLVGQKRYAELII